MSNEIIQAGGASSPALSKIDEAAIKLLNPKMNNSDAVIFARQCQRTGLDPFTNQIYSISRAGKMTIQVSIDGLRIIAERTGNYEGQIPLMWCDDSGKWFDIWLKGDPPAAARAGVYRRGFREPVIAIALWREFYKNTSNGLAKSMPSHMIGKCAEALALRKAFPNDMSGLYIREEMIQADEREIKKTPAKLPESTPGQPDDFITLDERKALFAAVQNAWIEIDDFKGFLKSEYNVTKSDSI